MKMLALVAFLAVSSAANPCVAIAGQSGCCKVCTTGKACGNSCIARDKNCHQPRGCACDG